MMGYLKNLTIIFTIFLGINLFAQDSEKIDIKTAEGDVKSKLSRISEIERNIQQMIDEAQKEGDMNWKVCLAQKMGTLKGVVASATNSAESVSDLIKAESFDKAQSVMALLNGFVDSAEKLSAEANGCERTLTSVNANSKSTKQTDKLKTGQTKTEGVNDALGMGFSDDFPTEGDKSNLEALSLADAGDVEKRDVPGETPNTTGEITESETESSQHIDKPEAIDVSLTK